MKITDIYKELEDNELDVEIFDLEDSGIEGSGIEGREKERILKKTLEKIAQINEKEKARQDRRGMGKVGRKKIGLLALAAVLLMGISASASERFRFNENLLAFLGISSQQQQENLESMAVDLEQVETAPGKMSDEVKEIRISANQAVSDGENVYIYFNIELPDGMFMDSDRQVPRIMRFRENLYRIGTSKDRNMGEMVILRNGNAPEQYYGIGEIGIDAFAAGDQEISLTFRNLGYIEADESGTKWKELADGEWTLHWKLKYFDVSRSYAVEKSLKIKECIAEIQSVRVSPFSVKVTGIAGNSESVADQIIAIDGIILADGSFADDVFKITWTDTGNGKLEMKGIFKNMTDIDDIKGIRINGEDIIWNEIAADTEEDKSLSVPAAAGHINLPDDIPESYGTESPC